MVAKHIWKLILWGRFILLTFISVPFTLCTCYTSVEKYIRLCTVFPVINNVYTKICFLREHLFLMWLQYVYFFSIFALKLITLLAHFLETGLCVQILLKDMHVRSALVHEHKCEILSVQ